MSKALKEVYFVTSNDNKYKEAKEILEGVVNLKRINMQLIEIQAKDFREVIINKLSQVIAHYPDKNTIVEDAGIVIDAFSKKREFPGIYAKDFYESVGLEGILNLMKGKKNRNAKMVCYVGYYDPDTTTIKIFKGEVRGKIAEEIKGKKGFGYDPIFIPEGHEETWGMNSELKLSTSHRYKAFKKLREFLSE